jgi:hypothetical protein
MLKKYFSHGKIYAPRAAGINASILSYSRVGALGDPHFFGCGNLLNLSKMGKALQKSRSIWKISLP